MSVVNNKSLVRRYYDEVINRRQLQIFDDLADSGFVSYLADGGSIGLASYKEAIVGTLGSDQFTCC